MLLLDYNTVEWACAVSTCRLYIKAVGSKANEAAATTAPDGRGPTAGLLRGQEPYCLAGSTSRWRGVRAMKRLGEVSRSWQKLAVSSILIGGGGDDRGEGFSTSAGQCAATRLRRLGEWTGAVLPRRLCVEAGGSEANEVVGSVVYPVSVKSTLYIKMGVNGKLKRMNKVLPALAS